MKIRMVLIMLMVALGSAVNSSYAETEAVNLFGEQENKNKLQLSLPGKTWALEVDINGFKVKTNEIKPDGQAREFFAENNDTGIIMSISLEKATLEGNHLKCREFYWNKAKETPFKKDDIQMREAGEMAIVEYLIKEFREMEVNQKNLNAYLAKDDIWIDMHLSKVDFKPGDEHLFESILNQSKFIDNYKPNRSECFYYASVFYYNRDFKKAIYYYEKLMGIEEKEVKFNKEIWRVIVDNLGMAYGLSGELEKARETFELGIRKDPIYPMFYYNLACTYAEFRDLENAIKNLKTAFKYKNNQNQGEGMPDPKKDSSFSHYLNNEKFLKVLSELN